MERFCRIVIVTSAVLFAFLYAKAVLGHQKFVVPARSDKYHHPTCRFVRKYRSDEMETFPSAKDARGAGYVPCKVCGPPDH